MDPSVTSGHSNAVEVLFDAIQIVSSERDTRDLVRSILTRVRDWTGCEAAGVRLHEGGDYPYFQVDGFSPHFVEMENSLCTRGGDGSILRDYTGSPVLDCMCGNILCGRSDPSKPFFTEAGSFWSNCTTELLASTTDEERLTRTRNRCNGEGYESVALIPLRASGDTIGLLQINDRRRDRFDANIISTLERIAGAVGAALAERQAGEALRASEGRYRALFEENLDGVLMTTTDGAILDANPTACALLGMSTEEVCARGRDGVLAPSDDHAQYLAERARTGRAAGAVTFVRKDDSRFPAEFISFVAPGADGNGRAFVIFRDISARLRTAEALIESEQRYHTLFDTMLEGCALCQMLYDEEGEPIDWVYLAINEALERTPGFAGITGRRGGEAFPGLMEMSPELLQTYARVAATGQPERFRIMRDPPGRWFDISVSSSTRGFFVTVLKDVTEALESEEKLRQSQKMEAVGRLAGGIAHDFNNVLTAIIGYSELLQAALEDGPQESRDDIAEIRLAAERAASLTRQILAFSRRQTLKPVVASLNDIVLGAERLLGRTLGEDISLITDLESGLGLVEVDVSQMEQVLMNLAVNARDAMPEGGKLTIATANVTADGTYCRVHPDVASGPQVMLRVSDTGTGMDPDTLARAFEPFFTTKEQGKGTGLGLSTVHGIVNQSGGSISIESEPGKGSTMRIYLPQVDAASSTLGVEHPETASFAGSETILVVEDEPAVRSLAGRVLRDLGYTVLEAGSGYEGFSIVSRGAALDLLLTDMVLPGNLQGKQLAEAVRAIRPDLPILFMSGYSRDAIGPAGRLELGADYLEKPFTPNVLARYVREVLDRA